MRDIYKQNVLSGRQLMPTVLDLSTTIASDR